MHSGHKLRVVTLALKEGGAYEIFVNIGQWSVQVSNVTREVPSKTTFARKQNRDTQDGGIILNIC
jgi:hypothetical protein